MSARLEVVPSQLYGYGELLRRNAEAFSGIDSYANETASDTSGFTGAMAALIPVVQGGTALYSETLRLARSRLLRVREELDNTAAEYEERERGIERLLGTVESALDGMRV
ncbi:hypothetical protein CDG81_20575 [Actinopolyspora erythraea]|uniref:ESX-1 secretion-associated protein n=1 Tax=Actinopolyspora erythraea TaxID=414996 RepID=A0A099D922_9ACTN|nr:hypothetical protein [Actinopolyspora erythraea]ASU80269.1 hypothetical protein CDG81_20575 [Actinopolyspora erythraea]KGI82648.1 hypothetical protein IL38_04305 [Actinopolyspora erythraea]